MPTTLADYPPVREAQLKRRIAQLEAEVQRLERELRDAQAFAGSVMQSGSGRLD